MTGPFGCVHGQGCLGHSDRRSGGQRHATADGRHQDQCLFQGRQSQLDASQEGVVLGKAAGS